MKIMKNKNVIFNSKKDVIFIINNYFIVIGKARKIHFLSKEEKQCQKK